MQILLDVSRASLREVALARGVNETTVARQLRAVEEQAGVVLFFREGRRLRPTEAARALIAAAEAMENALASAMHATPLRPRVRVATVAILADRVLAPSLDRLPALSTGPLVSIATSNDLVSLAHREADISLRLARPDEGRLLIRRLGTLTFRLVAKAGTQPAGLICYLDDLDGVPEMRAGLAALGGTPQVRLPDLASIRAAVRCGVGAAMLPEQMLSDDLVVVDRQVVAERDIWMVIHEDLKDRPAVRQVADWIADAVPRALARSWLADL